MSAAGHLDHPAHGIRPTVNRTKAERVLLVLAAVIITSDVVGWFLVLAR